MLKSFCRQAPPICDEKMTTNQESLEAELSNLPEEPSIQRSVSDSFTMPLGEWLRELRIRHDGYSILKGSRTEDRLISLVLIAADKSKCELTAVFDGHGGTDEVSSRAAIIARRFSLENPLIDSSPESIQSFLYELDRILVEECLQLSRQLRMGGTTGSITIRTSTGAVYNINRGDSRVVIYSAVTGEILFQSVDQDVYNFQKVHGKNSSPPGSIITRGGIYFQCLRSRKELMMFDSYGDADCHFIDRESPPAMLIFQIPGGITVVILFTTDGLFEIWKLKFIKNGIQYKPSGAFRGFVEERDESISALIVQLYNSGELSTLQDRLIPDQIEHTCRLYEEYLSNLSSDMRAAIEGMGYDVDTLKEEFPKQFDNHDTKVIVIEPEIDCSSGRSITL
jgi:serine/threonine protein phosphatase PrpC